jgi:hypothetical protein
MTPISLSWDTREGSIRFKWSRVLSLEWEKRKVFMKILGFPKSLGSKQENIHFPVRWVYLKGTLSFLKEWKLKKLEGTLSFPDPMVNGLLYGLTSAIDAGKTDRKIDVTINFLGENWCRGEVIISLKMLFHHLRRWIVPFIKEMRVRRPLRGGGL